MKITRELLNKYDTCKKGIDFIEKYYPDGAEALQIVAEHEVPLEMLHFARQHFDLNEEEIKKYYELCEVDENSTNIWSSSKIYNSKNVSSSKEVNESSFVYNSLDVYKSSDIYSSTNIEESSNILDGDNISSSERIISSKNIDFCTQIIGSEDIQWSENLLHSFHIEDSAYLYVCKNSINCYFGGFLEDCQNCLFCYGLKNKKNYIFNQQVSENEFEIWKEKLLFKLNREQNSIVEVNYNNHSGNRFTFYVSLFDIFKDISSDFFGWIGTIPYYVEPVFMNLFFGKKDNE